MKPKCVHLVGNSLGGYLAVMISYARPDLIKSIALLNPTPFWAFNGHDEGISYLKRPSRLKIILDGIQEKLGRFYFNLLRDRNTIKNVLETLYQSPEAVDNTLVDDIITAANHPGGDVAFTSIMFAPKSELTFDEMLMALDDNKISICMINGKEDPWISPFWGQRIKRMKPRTLYFQLSPTGHCPHHEG